MGRHWAGIPLSLLQNVLEIQSWLENVKLDNDLFLPLLS